MRSDQIEDLITPAEAARLRGVTRAAITDLVKRGRLRAIEIGGRPFLYRKEVMGFTPEITGRPRKTVKEQQAGKKKKKGTC